jgi:hypothetical protein
MVWDPRPPVRRAWAGTITGLGTAATAVLSVPKAVWSGIAWCGASIWTGIIGAFSVIGSAVTAGGHAISYAGVVTMKFIGDIIMGAVALLLRHLKFIFVVLFICAVAIVASYFAHWMLHQHPVAHPLYRPPEANAFDRSFSRETKDSPNGDLYYLVNIFFIPFQTVLVVIGGFVAWRTLGQGHKFKQYDVESNCIKEYLSIEEELAKATTNEQRVRAWRQYWVLMLYEYYWWRQDLLSRAIFTNWCEFRRQRFGKMEPFTKIDGGALPFQSYLGGYTYFRRRKVFPRGGPFDKLMKYLIRERDRDSPITWFEIEHFRHGWQPPV